MSPLANRSLTLLFLLLATPAFAGGEITVERSTVQDLKAVFATVETADVINARARIGGTLSRLSVDEGSPVSKGQIIARVSDAKLKLRMNALKARLQSVKSRRDLARTALDRAEKLFKSGTIAQKRLDEAKTALVVVEREFVALGADLAVISEQQDEGVVLAPVDGRVTKVHVTEGSVVLPGETIATIVAKGFVLRLMLPERHARFIALGDTVQIGKRGLAADGAIARSGTIIQVYPELRQGRVVADVAVDGLGDFFVGERVRVYIGTGKRQTIIIPASYAFLRYGLTFVRLKDGGDVVVQPGRLTPEGVEILSGLNPGDVLVEIDDK